MNKLVKNYIYFVIPKLSRFSHHKVVIMMWSALSGKIHLKGDVGVAYFIEMVFSNLMVRLCNSSKVAVRAEREFHPS